MLSLNTEWLAGVGVTGLTEEQTRHALAAVYQQLQLSVGMRIARQMSDEQLDEFEVYIDTDDKAGALRWLEGNFPAYKQVVHQELAVVEAMIAADRCGFVDSLRAATGGGQA